MKLITNMTQMKMNAVYEVGQLSFVLSVVLVFVQLSVIDNGFVSSFSLVHPTTATKHQFSTILQGTNVMDSYDNLMVLQQKKYGGSSISSVSTGRINRWSSASSSSSNPLQIKINEKISSKRNDEIEYLLFAAKRLALLEEQIQQEQQQQQTQIETLIESKKTIATPSPVVELVKTIKKDRIVLDQYSNLASLQQKHQEKQVTLTRDIKTNDYQLPEIKMNKKISSQRNDELERLFNVGKQIPLSDTKEEQMTVLEAVGTNTIVSPLTVTDLQPFFEDDVMEDNDDDTKFVTEYQVSNSITPAEDSRQFSALSFAAPHATGTYDNYNYDNQQMDIIQQQISLLQENQNQLKQQLLETQHIKQQLLELKQIKEKLIQEKQRQYTPIY